MYNMYTCSIHAPASAVLVYIQQASVILQVSFKATTKVGQCFTNTNLSLRRLDSVSRSPIYASKTLDGGLLSLRYINTTFLWSLRPFSFSIWRFAIIFSFVCSAINEYGSFKIGAVVRSNDCLVFVVMAALGLSGELSNHCFSTP